jgi:hypothetical protein
MMTTHNIAAKAVLPRGYWARLLRELLEEAQCCEHTPEWLRPKAFLASLILGKRRVGHGR